MEAKHGTRIFVLIIAVISLAGCQDWEGRGNGFVANNSGRVVMYSTSWCPHCKTARQFFDRNNINYIEYDIEESEEGKRQFFELRGRGVPLILVGDEKISGWNAAAVKAALARFEASGSSQDLSPTASDEADQGISIIEQEIEQEFRKERGYIIHLRDGRKIKVKDYWEKGDEIKYFRLGGIMGVKRERVAVIESRADGTKKLYNPPSTQRR